MPNLQSCGLNLFWNTQLDKVDMRTWIRTALKAEISLFEILSGTSIQPLEEKIAKALCTNALAARDMSF